MFRRGLSLLIASGAVSACDPLKGFDPGCFLCVGPDLSISDNVSLLKGDTVRVRASWLAQAPRGSWTVSDPNVAAFQLGGAMTARVAGPTDNVLLRALRSNAGATLTLTPAANPDLPVSVPFNVVDSSQVHRIAFQYSPPNDTVRLTVGTEISIEPTLWMATGTRVMGWPETISMSDTLVIAEVLPSPAAFPRLVHFRAMQPGTSHVTASFRQAEKVLTVVVSP